MNRGPTFGIRIEKAAAKKRVTPAQLDAIADAIARARSEKAREDRAKTRTGGAPAPDVTGRNAVRDAAAAMTVRRDPDPSPAQVSAQKSESANEVLAWIRARRKIQGESA